LAEHFDISKLYRHRFSSELELERKDKIWRVLCRHFFQRYIKPSDTVVDLGAGYCEFLNNIDCTHRIAVDLNPEIDKYARQGTQIIRSPCTDLTEIESSSVDVVFTSNLFEHLPNKETFIKCLEEIRRVLRSGGRLLILQPNIRVLGGKYWDFVDHHLPLTDRTLVEALGLVGLDVLEVRPRFLPYTTKSRLPQHPILVRIYLMFPIVHRFLGGQAWVVGVKP
jgi:SAM-dependent methyltransferase